MNEKSRKEHWELVRDRNKFVTFCSICGLPLTVMQEAQCIEDVEFVDFIAHRRGFMKLCLCIDCRNKIMTHNKGGMKKAIKRFEETLKTDQEVRKNRRR